MNLSTRSLIFVAIIICFQCNYKKSVSTSISLNGTIPDGGVKQLHLLNQFGDTTATIPTTNSKFNLLRDDVGEGYYSLIYGNEKAHLYLAPKDSILLRLDKDEINISGRGAARNNYLKRKFSSEFDWYSNYYNTNQRGELIAYLRDHYISKLKEELLKLSDHSQFIANETMELDYEYADRLLTYKFSFEDNPNLDESIAQDLAWAKSISLDTDRLSNNKKHISVVAKNLVFRNDIDQGNLEAHYENINHPSLKTHFLSSLVQALFKELQFGEDDYNKSMAVETFINSKQPIDSIGYNIFRLYRTFQDAEGKLASFSYEDVNDKTVTLEDLRGNYVYIDFWATWCTFCIKEFPSLKKLEQRFKDEKIEFIGISIDKPELKEKWKRMVDEKELTNIQLISPFQGYPEKDKIDDPFIKLVYVNSWFLGIPHYTLIDPEGKIFNTYFYRPSNSKLEKYLSELLARHGAD